MNRVSNGERHSTQNSTEGLAAPPDVGAHQYFVCSSRRDANRARLVIAFLSPAAESAKGWRLPRNQDRSAAKNVVPLSHHRRHTWRPYHSMRAREMSGRNYSLDETPYNL